MYIIWSILPFVKSSASLSFLGVVLFPETPEIKYIHIHIYLQRRPRPLLKLTYEMSVLPHYLKIGIIRIIIRNYLLNSNSCTMFCVIDEYTSQPLILALTVIELSMDRDTNTLACFFMRYNFTFIYSSRRKE